jgi:hypothetical protein
MVHVSNVVAVVSQQPVLVVARTAPLVKWLILLARTRASIVRRGAIPLEARACVLRARLGGMGPEQIWVVASSVPSVSIRLGRSRLQHAMIVPLVLTKEYPALVTVTVAYQESTLQALATLNAPSALLALQLPIPHPQHVSHVL